GVYCHKGAPAFSRCIISNNSAVLGGGVYCYLTYGITFTSCIIAGNSANLRGGGIYDSSAGAAFFNCVISYNHAESYGAAIRTRGGKFINCIIWANTGDYDVINTDSVTVLYCDVQHILRPGARHDWITEGNIEADPLFRDPLNGDFHLTPGSPCINAGDPDYVPADSDLDIDAQPRIINGRIDMGVDEFDTAVPILRVLPDSLQFLSWHGGPPPASTIVSVYNAGGAALNWTLTSDCQWAHVTPDTGHCPVNCDPIEVTLSIDPSALLPRVHRCDLILTDSNALNSPLHVPITFELIAQYGGGSGTVEDPYLIYNAAHLNALGATRQDWDKHFKLMNDIDLAAYTQTSYKIIGQKHRYPQPHEPFTGTFDGNGRVISNFTYESTDWTEQTIAVGLFGYVAGAQAEIRNLGLVACRVSTQWGYTGALVGLLEEGSVTNCYVEAGYLSGKAVAPLTAVTVGGLVGRSSGTIARCYSIASVTGDFMSGGLVAYNLNHGSISQCYSLSDVWGCRQVGGLVGWNSCRASIADCYAGGSATASCSHVSLGGLVGFNDYDIADDGGLNCEAALLRCFSSTRVSGNADNPGGLVGSGLDSSSTADSFWDIDKSGQLYSDGGRGRSTALMQTRSTYTDHGWDFVGETENGTDDIWLLCPGVADYPSLAWEHAGAIAVSPADLDGDSDVDMNDFALFASQWKMIETAGTTPVPAGPVVVDGALSEWTNALWLPLDDLYYGNCADVTEAWYALLWSGGTNKLYAAVMVVDHDHVFTDERIAWNAGDRIEIYSQGDAEGGTGWNGKQQEGMYHIAQQYLVAPNTTGGAWATWGEGQQIEP
ncbi:MAG: hypothetical protein JSW59_06710, partial [Phycisphaerales bacterium]